MNDKTSMAHRASRLETPTSLGAEARRDITGALNALLADFFALYLKTKNFHWHVSGPHFRDYHLLLDEQADQLFATTDVIAERVRKLGGTTVRSIGHVARLQRVLDNDADYVTPLDMLAELREDNARLVDRRQRDRLRPAAAGAGWAKPPNANVRNANSITSLASGTLQLLRHLRVFRVLGIEFAQLLHVA